jgi:GDP-L-fucose synthase
MKKKIYLSGGNGMVGRNIINHIESKNYKILSPKSSDLNLLNYNETKNFITKNKPDIIIHTAGVVGGIEANINNPVKFLVQNTQMGLNILTASKEMKIKNFINLGSSCMYPHNSNNSLSEEQILSGKLESTNEGYALAKICTTKLCEYLNSEDNSLLYKTIIPCNLYGKYDNFDNNSSHMIPAVIKKIHEAKKNKLQFVDIWGDGHARREFMYASDLADFIYFAIKNFYKMPQNINVGIGEDHSINDYYKKIANIIGFKGKFINDLSKPIGMKKKLINNQKLIEFGWKHKTSLEDGIKRTYEYFLKVEEK